MARRRRKKSNDADVLIGIFILLGLCLVIRITNSIFDFFKSLQWWGWLIIVFVIIVAIILAVLYRLKKDKKKENEKETSLSESGAQADDFSAKESELNRYVEHYDNLAHNKIQPVIEYNNESVYQKKKLLTEAERKMYLKLQEIVENRYLLQTQVNLASVVDKMIYGYQNELFRNIDFGIFDKMTSECLLLIELNDSTHLYESRRIRDKKVCDILKQANIPLLTFWTGMANDKEYIKNKLKEFIDI